MKSGLILLIFLISASLIINNRLNSKRNIAPLTEETTSKKPCTEVCNKHKTKCLNKKVTRSENKKAKKLAEEILAKEEYDAIEDAKSKENSDPNSAAKAESLAVESVKAIVEQQKTSPATEEELNNNTSKRRCSDICKEYKKECKANKILKLANEIVNNKEQDLATENAVQAVQKLKSTTNN